MEVAGKSPLAVILEISITGTLLYEYVASYGVSPGVSADVLPWASLAVSQAASSGDSSVSSS